MEELDYSDLGSRLEGEFIARGLEETASVESLRQGIVVDTGFSRAEECEKVLREFASAEHLEFFAPEGEPEWPGEVNDLVRARLREAEAAATEDRRLAEFPELVGAADAEDPRALNELASRLIFGEGVPVDQARAATLYQRAAELGNADAMFNLASCYLEGQGVRRNVESALAWLENAARNQDPFAALRLGELYAEGQQVERDTAKAAECYRLAERLGHQDARKRLREIGVLPPL